MLSCVKAKRASGARGEDVCTAIRTWDFGDILRRGRVTNFPPQ